MLLVKPAILILCSLYTLVVIILIQQLHIHLFFSFLQKVKILVNLASIPVPIAFNALLQTKKCLIFISGFALDYLKQENLNPITADL